MFSSFIILFSIANLNILLSGRSGKIKSSAKVENMFRKAWKLGGSVSFDKIDLIIKSIVDLIIGIESGRETNFYIP